MARISFELELPDPRPGDHPNLSITFRTDDLEGAEIMALYNVIAFTLPEVIDSFELEM